MSLGRAAELSQMPVEQRLESQLALWLVLRSHPSGGLLCCLLKQSVNERLIGLRLLSRQPAKLHQQAWRHRSASGGNCTVISLAPGAGRTPDLLRIYVPEWGNLKS